MTPAALHYSVPRVPDKQGTGSCRADRRRRPLALQQSSDHKRVHVFFWVPPAKWMDSTQIRPWPLPSKSFLIHQSPYNSWHIKPSMLGGSLRTSAKKWQRLSHASVGIALPSAWNEACSAGHTTECSSKTFCTEFNRQYFRMQMTGAKLSA